MKKELGRQILYNYAFPDNTVIHWDVLKVQYGQVLCLEFISVNSKYRQGVRTQVMVILRLTINGQKRYIYGRILVRAKCT